MTNKKWIKMCNKVYRNPSTTVVKTTDLTELPYILLAKYKDGWYSESYKIIDKKNVIAAICGICDKDTIEDTVNATMFKSCAGELCFDTELINAITNEKSTYGLTDQVLLIKTGKTHYIIAPLLPDKILEV